MVTIHVKFFTASAENPTEEIALEVPPDCESALERMEGEVDFSLIKRLKFDMKLLLNGRELPASAWDSTELKDGDRLVVIPGVGGG